mgnify:CR=1 FL=1
MKRIFISLLTLVTFISCSDRKGVDIEQRVETYLSQMTLEEKVAQMDIIRGVEFSTKPHKLYHCAVEVDSEINEEKLIKFYNENYSFDFLNEICKVILKKQQGR